MRLVVVKREEAKRGLVLLPGAGSWNVRLPGPHASAASLAGLHWLAFLTLML
jgi:hypothetical protein